MTKKNPCWSHVINQANDSIDILLHDVIGFWGTQSDEFKQLLNENKEKSINVDINSPGGSVTDGFSIYNSLKSHNGTVNVKVSGLAASIASLIMLAGDTREISENAEVMIHQAQGMGFGTSKDLRKTADRLDRIENNLVNVYASFIKDSTTEEIKSMMVEETWFTANQAVEKGLMQKVVDKNEESTNYFDFSEMNFYNIPDRVRQKFEKKFESNLGKPAKEIGKTKPKPEVEHMNLEEFKNKHPDLYGEVLNLGIAKERDRVSAHLVMGESSGAMETACTAIKEGTEMTATLQAKYMAAGMNKKDLKNRQDDNPGDVTDPENKDGDSSDKVVALVEEKLGISAK